MKHKLKRACIYTKDVQIITGKSDRQSRRLLNEVRNHFKKEDHHLLSIEEFCEYTGLKLEDILQYIIG